MALNNPYALSFDGVNDYVRVSYDAKLCPTQLSIMAIITKTKNAQQYIASKAQNGGYFFWISRDGNLGFSVYIGGSYRSLNSQVSLANGTYSVCGTYDGSHMRLYIDGELVAEQAQTGNITYSVNNALMIGCDPGTGSNPDSSAPYYYQGAIDNVSFWNRRLTPEEVYIYHYRRLRGDENGLVAYYKFDETSGTIAYDSGPNGLNGDIVGATRIDGLADICSLPDNYGTNVEYYISQQTGGDNNDGLTPQTAWKTIDKAISTVLPVQDSSVVVYIAPGTYRESIVFNGSINDNEKIIFKGDPDCLHFPDCISGPVRISGYQEDEQTPIESITPTNPFLVLCYGKVVFDTIEFYCPINGLIGDSFINCKVWSCLAGISLFTFAKNCEVYSNHIGFNGLSTSVSSAYNCICFSNMSCFNLSSCYHCFGIGLTAFNSCVSYNCAAQYSQTGFSGGSCYNCIASNCQNGFTSTSGSNRKSIGCAANTGDSIGDQFYFMPEIKTIIKNGIVDKGIPIVDNPTDLLGLERAGGDGNIDIGPIESCDYSLEYNDYYVSAPAVRINRKGQLSFKFRINAGDRVIKQVTVKHVNTSEDLKPQVIIRGLGINLIQTASYDNNMWETLTLSFTAPVSGVMEMILSARDPNENSYSLFSNPL